MTTQLQPSYEELLRLYEDAALHVRQLDSLLGATEDFNYIFDRQGRFSYINPALLSLLQIQREQAIGRNFHDLNYPVELATRLQAQIEQVFETQKPLKDETPFSNPAGKTGYYEYIFVPVFNAHGTVEAVAGSTRDISEHKSALLATQKAEDALNRLNRHLEHEVISRSTELLKKESELEQVRKLEAIGRLAGGVAHDFNNLIMGISGVVREVQAEMPDQDPRRQDLDEVVQACDRAFGLTKQLLAFGQRQIIHPEVMNVNTVIEGVMRLITRLIGEDITIETDLQAQANVKIDSGQFEQVMMNLAVNARDAMPEGGKLTIRTRDTNLEVNDSSRRLQAPAGPYVKIEVADTGTGMAQKVLAHLFEPFFTTKTKDKGTGLGLSTVYGNVQMSGGDIRVVSEIGIGSTFEIYLPMTQEEARAAVTLKNPAVAGHETLLVVEDESIVRHVLMRKLKNSGYTVLEASSPKQALQCVETQGSKIQLILTDVIMPDMNGRQLVQTILKKHPDIKVLYISGYPQDIVASQGLLEPGIHYLEKANLMSDLLPKLREILQPRKEDRI